MVVKAVNIEIEQLVILQHNVDHMIKNIQRKGICSLEMNAYLEYLVLQLNCSQYNHHKIDVALF